MRYVVAYDVSDDDTRLDIAKILGAFGWRVQESVFEVELDETGRDELVANLQAVLDPPEKGSVRMYRLCAECEKAARGIGVQRQHLGDAGCAVV